MPRLFRSWKKRAVVLQDGPRILRSAEVGNISVSILEWHWPEIVDYISTEETLSIEMSLPPYWSAGTASFPDIDPNDYCPMGRVFIRFPFHAVRGRGPGGIIRLLRCTFDEQTSSRVLSAAPEPDRDFLKGLLDIQDTHLRFVLHSIHRDMSRHPDAITRRLPFLSDLLEVWITRQMGTKCPASDRPALQDWKFARMKDALELAGGRTSVRELAQVCDLSVRQLQRLFRRKSGEVLSSFVREAWLDHARDLLCETKMPILEIARAVGFSSNSTFSRAFSQAMGLTPSSYRRMESGNAGPEVRNRPANPGRHSLYFEGA